MSGTMHRTCMSISFLCMSFSIWSISVFKHFMEALNWFLSSTHFYTIMNKHVIYRQPIQPYTVPCVTLFPLIMIVPFHLIVEVIHWGAMRMTFVPLTLCSLHRSWYQIGWWVPHPMWRHDTVICPVHEMIIVQIELRWGGRLSMVLNLANHTCQVKGMTIA